MNWFEHRINFLEDLCQEKNAKVLELTAELEAKNKQIAELNQKLAKKDDADYLSLKLKHNELEKDYNKLKNIINKTISDRLKKLKCKGN